jgi:uncharacterized protein YbjT (DUF2867 family)
LIIENVLGNLSDPKFINKAMHGVDTVVHIAGIHNSFKNYQVSNKM